jgi:alpha-ketoglutarate-dependent taurine dioxygenase
VIFTLDGDGQPLSSLESGPIIERFVQRGALLFRGFSVESFGAFCDRFSRHTLPALHVGLNRDRVPGDEGTMTVDLGCKVVGYHCEMGYSPARPELLWFHCLQAAPRGGETLLADGVAMLSRMPPSLESLFRARRLRYRFRGADARIWGLFIGDAVDRDEALRRLASVPDLRALPDGAERIDIEYVTSAIRQTRAGDEALIHSIAIFDDDRVAFEDGAPIDRALRLELAALATDCSVEVRWQAGDVLLVDNTRLLHGRMPFPEGTRRIHVRMTLAGF